MRLAAEPIRLVYLGLFALALKALGARVVRPGAPAAARRAIDEAMSRRGNPGVRVDVVTLGALGPVALSLLVAIPGLLLYPLYEIPTVLTILVTISMVCTAFSLTQLVHFAFASIDRRRWVKQGRPDEWGVGLLARPNGVDAPVWAGLAALLVAHAV